MSKEMLYAARIAARAITINEVPQDKQDAVFSLLSESDQRHQQEILDQASTSSSASNTPSDKK